MAVEAGFQMVVLPIMTGAMFRFEAIEVKLNGLTASTKPSRALYSILFN